MSKLGFDRILRNLERVEKQFLRGGIDLAQKEFKKNFDKESDAEKGAPWKMVKRGVPPPILDVTGKLRAEALSKGNVKIIGNRGILTIDPIDDRGRGYAEYHQIGEGVTQRSFVTQSSDLDNQQLNLLTILADKVFG